MSYPDFIIIGAMKCGTSTLQTQLAAQEGVFMSTPKEPNYFSDDAIFAKGDDWYRALFAPAPADALKGEASTHYTKRPTHGLACARMAQTLPGVKLIYLMRHPIDRLVSHYIHDWTQREGPANIEQAARDGSIYVDYGRYAFQLEPYINAFGRARILPVFLERLQETPHDEFARIARFLGREKMQWRSGIEQQNVSRERIRKVPMQKLLIDNPVAAGLRRAFAPRALRNWLKARLQMRNRPELPPQSVEQLENIFDEDLRSLGADLGVALNCRNFSQTVRQGPLDWVENT